MFMSRDQNAGRSHSMKTDNSTFQKVEEFKYLGIKLTNQNSIQIEFRKRLLSFGEESLVFQFAIQIFKKLQFYLLFVWV